MENTTEQRAKYARAVGLYFIVMGALLSGIGVWVFIQRAPEGLGDKLFLGAIVAVGFIYIFRGFKLKNAPK